MKIINDHGIEIPPSILTDALAKIEEKLQFYIDGGHYSWEGCHCHGHYVIEDRGSEAEEGMRALTHLKQTLSNAEWEGDW